MKTEIYDDGKLCVEAETKKESHELCQWAIRNKEAIKRAKKLELVIKFNVETA